MKYYISYDGDDHVFAGTSLIRAENAFWFSVKHNDWCPALEDEEGFVLLAWDNSSYDRESCLTTLIGPMEDPNPEPGIDRAAEEHEYRFGDWRL